MVSPGEGGGGACLYERAKVGIPELDAALTVAAHHGPIRQNMHSPDAQILLPSASTCAVKRFSIAEVRAKHALECCETHSEILEHHQCML